MKSEMRSYVKGTGSREMDIVDEKGLRCVLMIQICQILAP